MAITHIQVLLPFHHIANALFGLFRPLLRKYPLTRYIYLKRGLFHVTHDIVLSFIFTLDRRI